MPTLIRLAATACLSGILYLPGPAAAQYWQNDWGWQQQQQQRPFGWGRPPGADRYGWSRPGWDRGEGFGGYQPRWSEPYRAPERVEVPRQRRAMPKVKVSNPTFYNYTPDRLADVALGAVCELKTATNAEPGVAAEPAIEPAPETQASFAQACAGAPNLSLRTLPQVGAAIAKHYAQHPRFIWSEQGAVGEKARAALATLAAADTVGLDPADYRVALPETANLDADATALALLRFDLALSAKALTYTLDATRGRIDPNKLSGYHDLPRKSVDLAAALGEIAQSSDVAAWLAGRNPDNAPFRALAAALAQERAGLAGLPDDKAKDAQERIGKLRMALERMRWLPRELGARHVFLNQPAFEVSFHNGAAAPLTMRVVIGKPEAQTYFFSDRIEDVTYNPYWNVPRSIVINEMLPKLWRDPSWLNRQGYEVSNRSGRQVASNAVDWAAVASNDVGIDVRQPPGDRNALGRLKIDFPNRHAIYLHDTPQKKLFARAERAFSHGCVRLQHPRAMAAALLGISVAEVDRNIARGENRSVPVPGDIPVHLAYFTAWPDAQGTVHYYKDVYRRDAHLAQAMAKTQAARSVQ